MEFEYRITIPVPLPTNLELSRTPLFVFGMEHRIDYRIGFSIPLPNMLFGWINTRFNIILIKIKQIKFKKNKTIKIKLVRESIIGK